MPTVVLLGPQRRRRTLGAVLGELGLAGPVATVTAGWQEREAEVGELAEHLGAAGCEAVNLRLHERAERVFAEDPELAAAHRARQDHLRALQRAYRLHLRHALAAARELLAAAGADGVLEPQRRLAVEEVRRIDDHHLERVRRVHREFADEVRPGERPGLVREREAISAELERCVALALAGGHVAVLLNRLRLFGLPGIAAGRPLVAWAAGAMVLGERVVLFHDGPPQGAGDAEVLEAGLGVAAEALPLPHAGRRLRLGDPLRVALLARRFAPRIPLTLDPGERVGFHEGRLVAAEGARWLRTSGEVVPLEPAAVEREVANGAARPAGEERWGAAVPAGEAAGGNGGSSAVGAATPATGGSPGRRHPAGAEAGDRRRPAGEAAASEPAHRPPLAIRELAARRDLGAAAVDAFLAGREVPIREGSTATFLYRGDADRVVLKHWIYALPSRQPFVRLAGTDLWFLVMEIPERSRVEYKIEVVEGRRRRLIRDPLNPRSARDPFGANSVLHGVGYETPEWTLPDPDARQGRLEELTVASEAFGGERPVRVYLPARFRPTRRYPLLVVHDGGDYLEYARLGTVLDNLIERLEIAPLVVALTESPRRLVEYAADPRHARFVVEELVPRLEERYPLEPDPASRGLLGASFGGVASLSTAWRYPGAFGRLLLQSGSFAFTDIGTRHKREKVFDPVVAFMNRFRDDPRRPAERLYVSCGIYESLIYENRSLVPLLQEAGMEVRYREARDGHNWESWRDRLREGLSWLFPGPLWMVYE